VEEGPGTEPEERRETGGDYERGHSSPHLA
jgi:hypothetical protein